MFCPECRAEYRPGFTHCTDCDVDLVHELPESDRREPKPNRDWMPMFPAVKRTYRDGRKTVHWWTWYKRRTGTWPSPSIAIHFVHWVVLLFGGGFLIWWCTEHDLSRWQFLGIFCLVALPYGILESWAKRSVKLKLLRHARRSAKLRGEREPISTP
jgi:hypothetical protein